MRIAVLVPFKSSNQKSRLAGYLGASDREAFALALLEDLLDVVSASPHLDCWVVTSDDEAAKAAARVGAGSVREDSDDGVNEAVLSGVRSIKGCDDFLVLPSDLATLSPSELDGAIRLKSQGMGIVISPSRTFNGTNLLLFSRDRMIPLRYDNDSFRGHLRGAGREGFKTAVYCPPGVMFDVDTRLDLRELSHSRISTRASSMARRLLA
ncbi:MAG: 2-phospho-L-lactate guanylyltransferase [archaeon]|nr:MAG: 2-phospho-L-lactate guanylyltransferase [archaeon]